jgi:hypothetical protein
MIRQGGADQGRRRLGRGESGLQLGLLRLQDTQLGDQGLRRRVLVDDQVDEVAGAPADLFQGRPLRVDGPWVRVGLGARVA